MSKRKISIFFIFLLSKFCVFTQNITGIINNYAAVTNISGAGITVSSATAFSPGDKIMLIQMKGALTNTANNSSSGDIISLGGAGTHEFLTVSSISGSVINCSTAPVNIYNVSSFVQVVRVPSYCMPNVTGTLTCNAWNGLTGTGGILVFDAGTLTLSGDINVTGLGFEGGDFASSSFCCSNGNFIGAFNATGGQKGESISNYIVNLNGLKGKQANGGGGANCGNSGGGGGGNAGLGGFGGNEYSGCGTFDDRGYGGTSLVSNVSSIFLGGGGGGGFRDNGQTSSDGGAGGGIVYIRANVINCNNRIIAASGQSVTVVNNDEGAGGGGAGGSVYIQCSNLNGALSVQVNGGFGGSNFNSVFPTNCHGPGGGGGGGVLATSISGFMGGIAFSAMGGAAGTVNNPISPCANTTYGAFPGTAGYSLNILPTPTLSYSVPVLSVSQNSVVCAGLSTTLTASGATSYTWFAGPLTSTNVVSPTSSTVYLLSGAVGTCSASLLYTVSVVPGPTVTVIGSPSICAGQTLSINASGANNYQWSNGATASNITVSPSVTTIYSLQASSGSCGTIKFHTVTVVPMPTLNITGASAICSGQTVTLSVGTASNYLWNTASNNSAIIVSPQNTTTYSVIGSNSNCTSTAVHVLSVTSTPTLTVAGSNTICTGTQGTISVSGANSYSWNTGPVFPTINVNPIATTVYSVAGSIGSCTSGISYTLVVVQTPSFNLSGAAHICSGNTVALIATGANNYTWNNGSNASVILVAPQNTTTYSVTSVNAPCSYSGQITVTVTPTPNVNITTSTPSLCTGSTANLTGSGAPTYSWSTGATTGNIQVSPNITAVYYLTGYNMQCSNTASILINVSTTPVLSAGSYSICEGVTSATIVASGANTYLWIPNVGLNNSTSATVIANPATSINYTLVGTTGACTASIIVPVKTFSIPVIQLSPTNLTICSGQAATYTANGAFAYSWVPATDFFNNSMNPILFYPASSQQYTVIGYGQNNCVGKTSTSVTVIKTPKTIVTSEVISICEGDRVTLSVAGANYYLWQPPDGLSAINGSLIVASPMTKQTYTIIGTSGTPPYQCSSTAILPLEVVPFPKLQILAPDSVCIGQQFKIEVHGAKNYTWTPSEVLSSPFIFNPTLKLQTAELFTVTGTAAGLCPATKTVAVEVKSIPQVNAGRDTTINFDEFYYLQGETNAANFLWKADRDIYINCINCLSTIITPSQSAYYTLEVENGHGCKARDIVHVNVTNDNGIFIPNCFSPNNDGVNDVFTPQGFGVISYTLQIFDRWGEKLHEGTGSFTSGVYDFWDGTYKGDMCKTDNYIYIFTYMLPGSKQLTKEGNIYLLGKK